jgi:methyl-accepting chemotaxis protein
MDIDWPDVLRAALSFFLIVVGIGIAWACLRLGGLFGRVSTSVNRMTDEVVPILSKAQTTMDGINTEIGRVDEIMQSAVATTKGAEKAVATVSRAVTAPAKKLSGLAAGVSEAMATFKARRAAEKADGEAAESSNEPQAAPPAGDDGTLSPRTSPYPGP